MQGVQKNYKLGSSRYINFMAWVLPIYHGRLHVVDRFLSNNLVRERVQSYDCMIVLYGVKLAWLADEFLK